MKISMLLLPFFCSMSVGVFAQNEQQFCRVMQAMMAEAKTGFPSFKGALKDAKKPDTYLLKPGIIEGSDFADGLVQISAFKQDANYGAMIKQDELRLLTNGIGNFTFSAADSGIYNTFKNFVGGLHQQCFKGYTMEEEKIPDYIKTYAKARVVISARPVLNSNHEPDVAKLVDEPLMTITLEKVLGVSTAVIRVKVNCVVKK